VNEYILNLGKYFFPFFFFLCIHKQALPHPSIILYLVLPKLFEDACAMCTTSLHTEPNWCILTVVGWSEWHVNYMDSFFL
jgi:hypothetical protein